MQLARLDHILMLALPVLALLWTVWHHLRVRRGRLPVLRPLPGLHDLDGWLGEGIEAGRPVHVATGASSPGSVGVTAESLAGLLIAERMAEQATHRGHHIAVTSGDAVNHLAVRGTTRRVYRAMGAGAAYQSARAQLVAHQTPVAYAAGVAQRYHLDPVDVSLVVGNAGVETLLIVGEGMRQQIPHIAATTSLTAMPVLALSADAVLIGEELFAAEAYLARSPSPQARLLTQDALRRIVVLLVVLGLLYQLLNASLRLGLPAL